MHHRCLFVLGLALAMGALVQAQQPRGNVMIQRSLDRENNPRHTPAQTAPRFLQDYRPILFEHQTPRRIIEVLATDDDDSSKGNTPYHFRMASNVDDYIRSSFGVKSFPNGANGDGMGVVTALRSFDRESQKEFHIPIVINDAGTPSMTGTSTLTVTIGDINDNKMRPGSKDILVYNYKGQASETPIGRVYVDDPDDWDLPDKKFVWRNEDHPLFSLNEDDGVITMNRGTHKGSYFLQFHVYDRKHVQEEIEANVTVTVKDIPETAVLNSGSIRIAYMTDEDFIRIWDYHAQQIVRSKAELFREKMAKLVGTSPDKVDVFSVQLKQEQPEPITDVRFSVQGSQHYYPFYLNGLVLLHKQEIEEELGINITMVGIDECLPGNVVGEGPCTNHLVISPLPYTVNANKTALVGVRTEVVANSTCGAQNFTAEETCHPSPCFNGGQCMEGKASIQCVCPEGYHGPRCQLMTSTFRDGYAWYKPLAMCDKSHISLEFLTHNDHGLLLYNGPITEPQSGEFFTSDFISLELENGRPRLLIDFDSGTVELLVNTKKPLNDSKWHRLDIFWDSERVHIDVDHCVGAEVTEPEDGSDPNFDSSGCQAQVTISPFNKYLNVNTPLQLGGLAHKLPDPELYLWTHIPHAKPFHGCIRNLQVNSEIYNLADSVISLNTHPGCLMLDGAWHEHPITQDCGPNAQPVCTCKPGWSGPSCSNPTNSSDMSYVNRADNYRIYSSLDSRSEFVNVQVPIKMVDEVKRYINQLVALENIREHNSHLLLYRDDGVEEGGKVVPRT